jgi:hypothetical protein
VARQLIHTSGFEQRLKITPFVVDTLPRKCIVLPEFRVQNVQGSQVPPRPAWFTVGKPRELVKEAASAIKARGLPGQFLIRCVRLEWPFRSQRIQFLI